MRGWDVSLHAPNRRASSLGGERWLREADDVEVAAAGVGGQIAIANSIEESPNTGGTLAVFLGPNNILSLRKILGADMFAKGGLYDNDNVEPNLKEYGIEIIEEKKWNRVDLVNTAANAPTGHVPQGQLKCMDVDVAKVLGSDSIGGASVNDPKNGL